MEKTSTAQLEDDVWVSVPATLHRLKYLLFSESAARAWRQSRESTSTPHIEQNAQARHERNI